MRDVQLTVLHVWPEQVEVSVELPAGSLPGLELPAQCRAGPAGERTLRDLRPELIVVGVSARSPRNNREWTRSAHCPVILVPDVLRPLTGRVVVGVCGTPASAAALVWGAAEADRCGAELVVVHAWQLHPTRLRELVSPRRAIAAHQSAEEDALGAWVHEVSGSCDVQLRAAHGGPLDRLVESGGDADVIVVGHHARSPLARLGHGALEEDLVRLAGCAVAVVPID